jgi:hypothetical protein
MLERVFAWARGDVRTASLDRERNRCVDAYDLVGKLPDGPDRAAAWAAFALQTYGDKLVGATRADGYVRSESARLARDAYRQAALCLDVARTGAGRVPDALPRWPTPIRSHDQLVGMREALETLRTFIAFELNDDHAPALARLDGELAKADRFWIEHPPPEIRGALGDALLHGLDEAYALGRRLAGGAT